MRGFKKIFFAFVNHLSVVTLFVVLAHSRAWAQDRGGATDDKSALSHEVSIHGLELRYLKNVTKNKNSGSPFSSDQENNYKEVQTLPYNLYVKFGFGPWVVRPHILLSQSQKFGELAMGYGWGPLELGATLNLDMRFASGDGDPVDPINTAVGAYGIYKVQGVPGWSWETRAKGAFVANNSMDGTSRDKERGFQALLDSHLYTAVNPQLAIGGSIALFYQMISQKNTQNGNRTTRDTYNLMVTLGLANVRYSF